MNAPQNPGEKARSIIGLRWPELLHEIAEQTDVVNLSLYSEGRYSSIIANNLRLASAWDPVGEARQQLASIDPNAKSATIFGVGMGYLPLTLLEDQTCLEELVVVPMSLSLFKQMIGIIDMSFWLDDPRVRLISPRDISELPDNFAVTTPLLQLTDVSGELLRDLIRQKFSESHNEAFQRDRSKILTENLKKNLLLSKGDADISMLFNSAQPAQAAVVIGAGPSLDHSIGRVAELQQQGAIIIAVDAALKALCEHRIFPDYVVVVDPLDWVIDFLDVKNSEARQCGLVYFPTACYRAIAQWPSRRYRAIGTHLRFNHYRKKCPTSVLFSSGSVIHPATDLAVRMGVGEIYLAGADFGYPLERTHAAAVNVAKSITEVDTGYSVRDYSGITMPSSMNFISYYRDLEQYIVKVAPNHIRFFNLGHISAKINSVEPVSLSTADVN